MARKIFVNLAVSDLPRAKAFFEKLGFEFNAQFTNDQGACMVVSDSIHVMLLVQAFFQTFTGKALSDPHTATEAILCVSLDSRDEVDALVANAVAAGGRETRAAQDHDFIYERAIEDLDGHQWEPFFMAPDAVPPQA